MNNTINFLLGREFKVMLSLLLLLIIVPSFGRNIQEQDLVINLLFTIIFMVSSVCLVNELKLFFWGLAFGIIAICLTWIQYNFPWITIISNFLYLSYTIFFFVLFIHIIKVLFHNPIIDLNLVFGALNGYVILGLIGCFLMILLNKNHPGSFAYQDQHSLGTYDFIYFSFINLTTLGFGDILPIKGPAKALSIVHALFGQLYLTVIVAMMVGKFLINPTHSKEKEEPNN